MDYLVPRFTRRCDGDLLASCRARIALNRLCASTILTHGFHNLLMTILASILSIYMTLGHYIRPLYKCKVRVKMFGLD